LTATNLTSGASIRINASGASREVLDAQGNPLVNVATGRTIRLFPLSIYAGRFDYNTGAFHGHITDLCAALS
jgi:hypothetical protein